MPSQHDVRLDAGRCQDRASDRLRELDRKEDELIFVPRFLLPHDNLAMRVEIHRRFRLLVDKNEIFVAPIKITAHGMALHTVEGVPRLEGRR